MSRSVRTTVPWIMAGTLLLASIPAHDPPSPRAGKVPGSFRALQHWGQARSYPRQAIPAAAHTDAAAFARRMPVAVSAKAVDPWISLGPDNIGGRTLAIAFDVDNPDIIYAGSASGGLWRSTTAGVGAAAWERIPTGHPVLAVSTIGTVPGDPQTLYIGTGEVYNHQNTGTAAAYRRTRGSYGVGILKTVDGGVTWTKSLDWSANQEHGVWTVRVNPLNPAVVWAATTDGVYKSTDAGLTWARSLRTVMATDLVIHATNPGIVVVGCGDFASTGHGIYRTDDGGDTWTKSTAGLPATFQGKIQLGASPSNPGIIYASIGNGFDFRNMESLATWLARSADAGRTWTVRSTEDYSRWQGWYAHDVAVHPNDPAIILTAGIDIWKSTNSGTDLVQKSDSGRAFAGDVAPGEPEGPPAYSHADNHDLVWHPTDPDIIYIANDGGVFRSLDGGETFEGCNGGYRTAQFYGGFASSPTDPNLAIGGLQDNSSAIYRGSRTWSRFQIGGDGAWAAIDPTDPNIMYGSLQFLVIAKSLNNGRNWNQDISPPARDVSSFIAPFVLAPSDPEILYAASDMLYRSNNGGNGWIRGNGTRPLDDNPALAMAVAHQNPDVLYVATAPFADRGTVQVTVDGAATFHDVTGDLPDRYPGDLAVDPADEAVVYLTLYGFGTSHVFRSGNYGADWEDIDRGLLPDVPFTAVVVDPMFPRNIYVGGDLGVFVTDDAGDTWSPFTDGMPPAALVYDLSISESDRRLRAATHGLGVYERDLLAETTEGEIPVVVTAVHLGQSVPNPFNPRTVIPYRLPVAGPVSLVVYDVRGRLIKTLVDAHRPEGIHEAAWDGTDWTGRRVASGTYHYRLRAGGETMTRSLQVLK